MSSDTYTLEPFPAFVDGVDPAKVNYFSKMGALQLLSPSGAVQLRRHQDTIASKITEYLSLRYYQYECTIGLYVMTTMEKLVCNFIILGILAAVSYGMYYGIHPFLIRSICQVLYYISGSLSGVEEICRGTSCS